MKDSFFDGGLLQLIGWKLLGAIVTIFTFGICYPWAVCMIYNWETKHTVINGKRLKFNGTALQLFGNWIKWWLLTLITLGIYGFWTGINLKKWITKHTEFESYYEEPIPQEMPRAPQTIAPSSVNTSSTVTVSANPTAAPTANFINGFLSLGLLFLGVPIAVAGLGLIFFDYILPGAIAVGLGLILLIVCNFNQ